MTESSAAEAAWAAIDEIAARGLAWAAPIGYAETQSAHEREAAFRLRYRAVVERGWYQPADFPDGLERDAYDDEAVQIVGWDDATAIATARLVFPHEGMLLPTEAAFDVRVEPRGRVVDAGRYVVAREYSNIEHRVLAGLLGASWLAVRARGFSHVCSAFASGPARRLYRLMGIRTTVLAPPRLYWGEERYPIRWETAVSLPALAERWRGLPNGGGPV